MEHNAPGRKVKTYREYIRTYYPNRARNEEMRAERPRDLAARMAKETLESAARAIVESKE